jgi:DNA processing protein
MTPEERGWLRLHLTPGLGRVGLVRLVEAFGSVEAILAATPSAWISRARIRNDVALALPKEESPTFEKTCRDIEKTGARIIPLTDAEQYPEPLRAIHDPPALLYVRGEMPKCDALAVVGSRRASEAGCRLTTEICAELAARGIIIVSGLARGIDTAAHRGALLGEGHTTAVLGCGIDRVYPPENSRLFLEILDKGGGILSEYPPGTQPLAGHFPGRNRIISGLSRGVLVVEAAEESGSLITVDFALEQGREVFAVPGPVFARTSRGVHRLLKDGARVVTDARDILDVLWPRCPSGHVRRQEETFASALSGDTLKLYRHLAEEPLHIDELVQKTGLTPMDVSDILLHLELQGGVLQLPGMRFIRNGRTG